MQSLTLWSSNNRSWPVGPEGDPNTETSLPYVPGAVVRGALAGRYLAQSGHDTGSVFAECFLHGAVRYLNAYLVYVEAQGTERRSLPVPAHWAREKDPVQGAKGLYETRLRPDRGGAK